MIAYNTSACICIFIMIVLSVGLGCILNCYMLSSLLGSLLFATLLYPVIFYYFVTLVIFMSYLRIFTKEIACYNHRLIVKIFGSCIDSLSHLRKFGSNDCIFGISRKIYGLYDCKFHLLPESCFLFSSPQLIITQLTESLVYWNMIGTVTAGI